MLIMYSINLKIIRVAHRRLESIYKKPELSQKDLVNALRLCNLIDNANRCMRIEINKYLKESVELPNFKRYL